MVSSEPSQGAVQRVAIVGAGLAGVTCAQALRAEGYAGEITLIGDEAREAYDRPCLSKEYLLGEIEWPRPLMAPGWAQVASVQELRQVRVTTLNATQRTLRLSDGHELHADAVVLATGARARQLCIPGSNLPGVCFLRTWDDAEKLRARMHLGCKVTLIGGGLIGAEVATAAQALGCSVTLLEAGSELLERGLGPEVGAFCRQALESRGVDVRLRAAVEQIEGETDVRLVRCHDGHAIAADLVVVCVGAEPASDLALAAGLDCAGGIRVDARGRTSVSGIYAAGDVACWPVAGGGQRCLESYINTQQQALTVARTILNQNAAPAEQTPRSWTAIAGHDIRVAGDMSLTGHTIFRGQLGSGACLAWRVNGHRLLGVIAVDALSEFSFAARLVERGELDPARLHELTDTTMPLKRLLTRA